MSLHVFFPVAVCAFGPEVVHHRRRPGAPDGEGAGRGGPEEGDDCVVPPEKAGVLEAVLERFGRRWLVGVGHRGSSAGRKD